MTDRGDFSFDFSTPTTGSISVIRTVNGGMAFDLGDARPPPSRSITRARIVGPATGALLGHAVWAVDALHYLFNVDSASASAGHD